MLNGMVGTAVRIACYGALCTVLPHAANAYRPYALRHSVLAFLNALLLALAVGTSLALSLTPEVARLSTITTSTLIRLTNAERARAGLPPLREDPLLQRSASLKAQHMIQRDYFDHVSPDGVSPWAWFDRARYAYVYAGENLAIDFTEAEDVVAAWVRSPGHRRNLLADRYADIGIAVATGEFEGRTATVVVQHFGALAAAPPGAPTAASAPRVAERQTAGKTAPAPTPAPTTALPPPVITEPTEGDLLGQARVAVHGTAPAGSTVEVLLDGAIVATLAAPQGAFSGSFAVPENEERTAALTARATREGRRSALAAPRRLTLDTRAPQIAADRAVVLPDPAGAPDTVLLALQGPPDIARATLALPGRDPLPLARTDGVLSIRLPLAALTPARGAETALPIILVADARGNAHSFTPQTLLPYVTAGPQASASRARTAAAATRVRPWAVSALAVLAALLAANIAIHLRLHRLLHADVLAHALTVLAIGTALLAVG